MLEKKITLQKNINYLWYDDAIHIFEKIGTLMKSIELDYKWIEGSLFVFPHNYKENEDNSRSVLLAQIYNFKNFYPESNEGLDIEFKIDFKNEKELLNILKEIKNNTYEGLWHEDLDTVTLINKPKTKKKSNKYLESLDSNEIDITLKSLKNTYKYLKELKVNKSMLFQLKYQIKTLKEFKKKSKQTF